MSSAYHPEPTLVLREGYREFLNLTTDEQRYQRLADIINNNANKIALKDWDKKDADVIIGLYDENRNKFVTLSLYLGARDVYSKLRTDGLSLEANVKRLYDDLIVTQEGGLNNFIEALRTAHPDGADLDKGIFGQTTDFASKLARGTGGFLKDCCQATGDKLNIATTATGHFLWTKRNTLQRAGLVIAPAAIPFAALGALTAKSAALTTAGTVMGNMLPGFVTAFAASHAIPLAAVAFYAIAAALGAAALILLLAGTGKQLVETYCKDHGKQTFLPLSHQGY